MKLIKTNKLKTLRDLQSKGVKRIDCALQFPKLTVDLPHEFMKMKPCFPFNGN